MESSKAMTVRLRPMDSLPPTGGPVEAGQTVFLGPHAGPIYRVIAVAGDKVWVRDEGWRSEHIVSVHRCYPAFVD